MTTFIFPSDVFSPRKVDEAFAEQAEAVRDSGGSVVVVDHDGISQTHVADRRFVLRGLLENLKEKDAVYRGWMLNLQQYSYLEVSLRGKSVNMLTTMPMYQNAHQLPGWYSHFEGLTPRSVWRFQHQEMPIGSLVDNLTSEAFIVKDFVKSRKSEWATACFASSRENLQSVADEFIRLQLDDGTLAGGLVIREFEEFDKGAGEARIWWVNGSAVLTTSHPDTPDLLPVIDHIFLGEVEAAVKRLGCKFVTTDVAIRKDGHPRVIEVGDGQVSGLPEGTDASALWNALIKR